MLESVGPLITAIRNAGPRIYAALFVATLLLLFLPEPTIGQLGLAEFVHSFRTYIGVGLLASGSLLAVQVLFALAPVAANRWKIWRLHKDTFQTLAALTIAEKEFLRSYIIDDQNSRYVSIYDGVANGLVAKAILYRASSVTVPGTPGMLCPYNLQPYARKVLSKRRHLLELS